MSKPRIQSIKDADQLGQIKNEIKGIFDAKSKKKIKRALMFDYQRARVIDMR